MLALILINPSQHAVGSGENGELENVKKRFMRVRVAGHQTVQYRESFSGILRVLGVHFPAEDGPEFFGPVWVQVGGGEAGAEGEPGSV